MQRRRRKNHGREQQGAIVAAGVVQSGLLGAALLHLRRWAAAEINGDKRAWVALSFVNFVGPIAYFAFGRRRADDAGGP